VKIKTYMVDAFTNEPFKGNPAGVCVLEKEIDPGAMQTIAGEINLSETAFLLQNAAEQTEFSIRYFAPAIEIPFCGHATLASAKIVLQRMEIAAAQFITHSGLKLAVRFDDPYIAMKFPLYETVDFAYEQAIFEAFDIKRPLDIRFSKDLKMLLVEVRDKETLEEIKPNFTAARKATGLLNNLVVTAKSVDRRFDFYSRCFGPWIGIDEDPVTGASHSVLAKYWGAKLNKTEMSAFQASKRGGFMNLKVLSDSELEVRSNARIIFEGKIEIRK
jgi:PhzF family phenazine biosynthesis protein